MPIPLLFNSPHALFAAALLGCAALLLASFRRVALSLSSKIFLTAGLLLLILATGDPAYLIPTARTIAVMVDLSPSTRGALYRDPSALKHRLTDLLPGIPFRLYFFSDFNQPGSLDLGAPLPETPCENTLFSPIPADAILLFTDGQFPPATSSPPIYPILDPLLDDPPDAAITGIEAIGDNVAVSVRNNAPARLLTVRSGQTTFTQPVRGNQTILTPAPQSGTVVAELSPADDWPENDHLTLRITPPANSQRWWLGPSCPQSWQPLTGLPLNPADYLAPSVIVLNNTPADSLSPESQDRLEQYVRDLGGGLVLLGGDHAFAAGGYTGTPLDSLSPLTSTPPSPAQSWIILTDASGSMSQLGHWQSAVQAIMHLLPALPPNDTVRVGQFSDTLRWWTAALPAHQIATLPLPPPDAFPHGPTNLQPALESLSAQHSALSTQHSLTHLFLLTDADTVIDHPADLAARLRAANIHLHLLAIAHGQGLSDLQSISRATGGNVLTQPDPAQWPAALRQLLTQALPDPISRDPIDITFLPPIASLARYRPNLWNPTWLKPSATPLANTADSRPLAATWHYGAGQVAAASFATTSAQAAALAERLAQPPHDPRFKISWNNAPTTTLAIDAVDHNVYLNNLNLTLELWNPDTAHTDRNPIPQSAPGSYTLTFPSPNYPAIATVRNGTRIIDRRALPAWYPQEFSAIGQDEAALRSLAQRTGGRVILPGQSDPIDFHWPPRSRSIAALLSAAAAASLAAGLLLWKFAS